MPNEWSPLASHGMFNRYSVATLHQQDKQTEARTDLKDTGTLEALASSKPFGKLTWPNEIQCARGQGNRTAARCVLRAESVSVSPPELPLHPNRGPDRSPRE